MRKLLVTLALAGTLSVPSVVFADEATEEAMEEAVEEAAGPSWYGSLRGGLQVGGGGDAQFFDGASRWGIKGSAEAGEGLTAVYKFEHMISTTNGGQPGGRLAYVGLSGGFGSLTLGQIGAAAFNHTGVITDKSAYFGDSGTGARHGNALSYAFSSGAVGFQLDLISDGGMDTNKAIDKTEFGMTIGLGEIGKVAIAHTNVRDSYVPELTKPTLATPYMPAVPGTDAIPEKYYVTTGTGADATEVEVKQIMVYLTGTQNADANTVVEGVLTTGGLALIERTGGRYHAAGALATECQTLADDGDDTSNCATVTAYVSTSETIRRTPGDQDTTTTVRETFHAEPDRTEDAVDAVAGTAAVEGVAADAGGEKTGNKVFPKYPADHKTRAGEDIRGHKATHVAVQFSLGGVTPHLGYSEMKENGTTDKSKTTHYGLSGGLGDTGMSFLVAARSVKDAKSKKTSPWLVNLSRSLGGGATVIFEHGNADDGKSGKSRVGLHVDF